MKKLISILTLSFVLFPGCAVAKAPIDTASVFYHTNEVRTVLKIPLLTQSAVLDKVAQDKLEDMKKNKYFSHTSPKGLTFTYWMKQEGYSYRTAGENLSKASGDAQQTVNAWVGSPAHLRNLVDKDFTEVGIATDDILVVQIFGTRLGN